MATYTMAITPNVKSYEILDGDEVLSVRLAGGASRFRKDQLGAVAQATVSWTVGSTDFRYLRAFYGVHGRRAQPFNIALILDEPVLTTHEAYFVPGTFKLASQEGQTYTVTAVLEVIPTPRTLAEDIAIITGVNPPEIPPASAPPGMIFLDGTDLKVNINGTIRTIQVI